MIAPHESFYSHWHQALGRYLKLRRERITTSVWPTDRPMVSVIISCDSSDAHLQEAVHSILNSSWQDLEVLILEDRSADDFAVFAPSLPACSRVRCIDPIQAKDDLLNPQMVRGKYILVLPSADLVGPNYIENAVYLLETTGVDLIVPDTLTFHTPEELQIAQTRREGRIRKYFGIPIPEIFESNTASAASIFRFSFLAEHNLQSYFAVARTPTQDLWKQLAGHGARYIHLPEAYHLGRVDSPAGHSHTRVLQGENEGTRPGTDRYNSFPMQAALERQSQRPTVRYPFVNLDRREAGPPRDNLNLLLCVPWFDNYGSAVLLSNIFRPLTKQGVAVTVLATNPGTDRYCTEGTARFLAFTKDCFYLTTCVPEGSKADFLSYIIRSRKIELLMIVSSQLAYESLPRLRREYPGLRVVDHLYNTEDHIPTNRKFASQIDFNIVVNDDVRAVLMKHGESPDRIRVIASGIDVDQFQPTRFDHPRSRGELLTFGYLGRFSEEKRPLDVVEMARRHPQFRFMMAGEGHMRPQIEEAIRRYDLADRLQLLGYRPAQVFFEMIDALIVPSRLEGLPNVLLEAMVLRKPTIATQVGMIPQVVQDGVNGFLYPSGDLDALSDKIRALAALPPESWLLLGGNARAKVIRDHNIALCAARYLETFRSIVASRP